MEIKFLHTAYDIIEGLVTGGLSGLGAYIVGGAVASLPNAFIGAGIVPTLSVLAGALGFVGYALPKLRNEISEQPKV